MKLLTGATGLQLKSGEREGGFLNLGSKVSGVQHDIMRIIIIQVCEQSARKGFGGLLMGLGWGWLKLYPGQCGKIPRDSYSLGGFWWADYCVFYYEIVRGNRQRIVRYPIDTVTHGSLPPTYVLVTGRRRKSTRTYSVCWGSNRPHSLRSWATGLEFIFEHRIAERCILHVLGAQCSRTTVDPESTFLGVYM